MAKVMALDSSNKLVTYESLYDASLDDDAGGMFRMVFRNHENGYLISTIKREYISQNMIGVEDSEANGMYETAVFKEGKWDSLHSDMTGNRDDALHAHKQAVNMARNGVFEERKRRTPVK